MNLHAIIAAIPSRTPEQRAAMRRNAEQLLAKKDDPLRNDARALTEALDAHEEALRMAHAERMAALPLAGRVAEAFRAHPPTETEVKLIQALVEHPRTTSRHLTEVCGWKAQSWHLHFADIGKKRESWLWSAPRSGKRDANFWCGILADFDRDGSLWTMKPEVAAGLAELGIAARASGNSDGPATNP